MQTELKVCRKCHLELPVTEFVVTDKLKGYRKARCRACEADRIRAYYHSNETYREKQKANNARSTERVRAAGKLPGIARRTMLKRKYGMTQEQFDALLVQQNGRCALCKTDQIGVTGQSGRYDGSRKWLADSWRVDHCHERGHVRGLLCHACNVRLGAYEWLMREVGQQNVLEYLTRPSPVLPAVVTDLRAGARFVADLPLRYTPGPPCSVEGCGKPSTARGLCAKHYARVLRTGDAGPAEHLPHTSGKGERSGKSKLTAEAVAIIKTSADSGVALAQRFGVTPTLISNIRLGKTWRHIN